MEDSIASLGGRNDQPRLTLVEINQRPAWSISDFASMLGLPLSTMVQVLAEHPAQTFKIGRRVYILKPDAMDWLNDLSIQTAQVPRTRRKKKMAGAI